MEAINKYLSNVKGLFYKENKVTKVLGGGSPNRILKIKIKFLFKKIYFALSHRA